MAFKDFVESHPLSVLVATVVGASVVVGGGVEWFAAQKADLREQRHEQAIRLTEAKLGQQIDDLKTRLLSIERRVGNKNLFLDVTKIPIPTSEVRVLSKDYVGFNEGRFYVSVPKYETWSMKVISQLDRATQMFGDEEILPSSASALGKVLAEKNIVTWQPEYSLNVSVLGPTGEQYISLIPAVMVMPLSQEYIRRVSQGFFEMFDDQLKQERTMGDLLSTLAKVKDDAASEPEHPVQNAKEEVPDGELVGKDNGEEPVAEIEQVLNTLSGVFGGDLAAFALQDAIQRGFLIATLLGGHYRVQAADKKGNVLYLRTQTILDKAQVDGSDEQTRVYLDEEFFYFGVGNRGMLIWITVPSRDLRSDAYAWTQAWLASLRIPVE